jgi:hypothetical protein
VIISEQEIFLPTKLLEEEENMGGNKLISSISSSTQISSDFI